MKLSGSSLFILVSLLLHVSVYFLVTLTSEPLPVCFRPTVISLGAIVTDEDVGRTRVVSELTTEAEPAPLALNLDHFSAWKPVEESHHNKGLFSGQMKDDSKVYRKSSFLRDDLDEIQKRELLRQLGIEPDIPPRRPLRLD